MSIPNQTSQNNTEIEVKFVVQRTTFDKVLNNKNPTVEKIEQIYMEKEIITPFFQEFPVTDHPQLETSDEYRIRTLNERCVFTAKTKKGDRGIERKELEYDISQALYQQIKSRVVAHPPLLQVLKTRYSVEASLYGQTILIQFDDYHETAGRTHTLDFVTCEIEVPTLSLADQILNGIELPSDLDFLKDGVNVTNDKRFSNKKLAANSFFVDSYQVILKES